MTANVVISRAAIHSIFYIRTVDIRIYNLIIDRGNKKSLLIR